MQLVGKLALNIFWIAAAIFILAASAASAQTYPPNVGSVHASTDNATPPVGATVEIFGQAFDSHGNPLAGVEVTFAITSNPGTARFPNGLDTITGTTDASGRATAVLDTGHAPGTIVVRVDAQGQVSQVTVTTGQPQALPQTGGRPGSDSSLPLDAAAVTLAGLALVAGGAVFTVRKLWTIPR